MRMDIEKIKTLLNQKLNELGYELIETKFVNKKDGDILSIVVDRVTPISMEDIVKISEVISSYLDEIMPIEMNSYTLDVSSLGAEKPIKIDRIKDYISSYVNVHLINPINGENIYEGVIKNVYEDYFELEIRIKNIKKVINILLSNIYNIRLAIKF